MQDYKKRFDYMERHRMKRHYTYTRTKAVVVFFLSGVFSIYFTPYFERYGPVIMSRIETIALDVFGIELDPNDPKAKKKQTSKPLSVSRREKLFDR